MTFEAPRELLDPSTRDPTLRRRSATSASTACACSSTGATTRPPRRRRRARLRRDRPGRLPRRQWDPSTGCSPRPRRAASRSSSRSPARCRAGRRKSKRDNVTDPARRSSARSRPRSGRRYGDRVELVVDLERAQPAAVPAAAVQEGQAGLAELYRKLFLAGHAGCADAGNGARHGAVRRDRAARQRARRRARSPSCAARCAWTRNYRKAKPLRATRGRRLRPPRLHDARRPALPPAGPRRRDDRRARRG